MSGSFTLNFVLTSGEEGIHGGGVSGVCFIGGLSRYVNMSAKQWGGSRLQFAFQGHISLHDYSHAVLDV